MKRVRAGLGEDLTRDTDDLLRLATGLAESGSRAEDSFWEERLHAEISEFLRTANEEAITAILDHLFTSDVRTYGVLADSLESCTEQVTLANGRHYLLIAAPVLAWSRYSIPATSIPAKILNNLRVHLQAHVLADKVRVTLADALFSPEQLPQGYCETTRFAQHLAGLPEGTQTFEVDTTKLPETGRFLSDVRYILGLIEVEAGKPIFRWQEEGVTREQAATQWNTQAGACLAPMLTGCSAQMILPDAFFAACRQSDRISRPYSVQASVSFLSTTLDIAPADLHAIIAPFHDRQTEEYRVGFSQHGSQNVVHGIVWPQLGPEDDLAEIPGEIESTLRECGVQHITVLEHRFPLEYCDDCGAPLYPSPEGEAVHAELPEEKAEQVPRHLH